MPQRAPGASVARLTRNKGGWKFPATPGACGFLRKTTNMQAGRAERPTLRGDPAAALGGWKMGCSAPATTSSMCGRCGNHAASNSIRTNLGFMDLGRGRCHSLLRFSPFFFCLKRPAPRCTIVRVSSAHSRQAASSSATGPGSLVVTWSYALLSTLSLAMEKHTSFHEAHSVVPLRQYEPRKRCVELTIDTKGGMTQTKSIPVKTKEHTARSPKRCLDPLSYADVDATRNKRINEGNPLGRSLASQPLTIEASTGG